MLKRLATYLTLPAAAFTTLVAQAQYNFVGSASSLGNNCYQLTAPVSWQNGAIWYNQSIDLTQPFHLQFVAFFGSNPNGADGMVFVMQQVSNTAIGMDGEGMGFSGFAPSFGVEFDTYQNQNQGDPAYDHIAFLSNGVVNHNSPNNLAGPVQASATSPNIKDGQEHIIDIYWTPQTSTFSVHFNCVERLTANVSLVNGIFQGNPVVFWGLTAATGGLANQHRVCLDPGILGLESSYEICAGGSVQLQATGTSLGTHNWTPTTGLSNPTVNNPIASPTQTTTYQVTFTDLCQNVQQQSTTIQVLQPGVTLPASVTGCEGQVVTLTATDVSGSVQWNTGSQGPTLSVNIPGTYTATATIGSCTATASVEVNFAPIPTFNLPVSASICQGASYPISLPQNGAVYTWNDGFTGAERLLTAAGTYTVTATLGACTAQSAIALQVNPVPVFSIGEPVEVCTGTPVTLWANVSGTVVWSTGASGPSITVQQNGTYWATASALGCSYSDTTTVLFHPLPQVDVSGETPFCESTGTTLTATGTDSYSWNHGASGSEVQVLSGGLYTVTGTHGPTGCQGTASIFVTSIPPTMVSLPALLEKCEGDVILLKAAGSPSYTFAWSDGTQGGELNAELPGLYTVTATGPCGEAEASVDVRDIFCSTDVFIPNAFTPDGDGLNDLFKATAPDALTFELRIYSRWGELVFHTAEVSKGWNGSFMNNGYYCEPGLYLVLYKATFAGMKVVERTGHLTLIR